MRMCQPLGSGTSSSLYIFYKLSAELNENELRQDVDGQADNE